MNSHNLDGVKFNSEICSRRIQNPSLPASMLISLGCSHLDFLLQGWKESCLLSGGGGMIISSRVLEDLHR